uniref:NADH-ubiquinone oxidoreductase chain 3 n=1 Tax=Mecistocirrus digitatus TaxID=237660 RepID=D3J8C8_MECDI|nr:NADH dehydrogenase subunit 3 [Mecistocirrus digitatus]ACX85083.1 NADH dehydrogenase subunit 3 [Mecistocirrus digitatus]
MLILFIVTMITIFLILLLYMMNFGMSIKKTELIKINTFESGFLSIGKIQSSFSIHFFIMMLMFIIFDLEIVMFLGLLVSDLSSLISFVMLMSFIIFGFYMEWMMGKLIWIV